MLVLSCSVVSDSVTPWAVAHQAPLSLGLFRQEYRNGLPCPPPGDLPYPGIEPTSLMFPALAGGSFTASATWEAWKLRHVEVNILSEHIASQWHNQDPNTGSQAPEFLLFTTASFGHLLCYDE